jgi:hypothetical protein
MGVYIEVLSNVCSQLPRSPISCQGTPYLQPAPKRDSPYSGIAKRLLTLDVHGCGALQDLYEKIFNDFRGRVRIKELAVENFVFWPGVHFITFDSTTAAQNAAHEISREYPDGIELEFANHMTLLRSRPPILMGNFDSSLRLVKRFYFA